MGLLDNILGGGAQNAGRGGGMSPITMALLGLLAYRTYQGKGRLADMLGRGPAGGLPGQAGAPGGMPAPGAATGGGLGGLLGGLLGGGAGGGILSGGLHDLLQQFQKNGQGARAESWIGTGPNQPIAPSELEQALGPERLNWLMQQTGLSRDELLAGLSRELPEAVDRMTPDGRIPSEQEAQRWI